METTPNVWSDSCYVHEEQIGNFMRELENYGIDMNTVHILPASDKPNYFLLVYRTPKGGE